MSVSSRGVIEQRERGGLLVRNKRYPSCGFGFITSELLIDIMSAKRRREESLLLEGGGGEGGDQEQ